MRDTYKTAVVAKAREIDPFDFCWKKQVAAIRQGKIRRPKLTKPARPDAQVAGSTLFHRFFSHREHRHDRNFAEDVVIDVSQPDEGQIGEGHGQSGIRTGVQFVRHVRQDTFVGNR